MELNSAVAEVADELIEAGIPLCLIRRQLGIHHAKLKARAEIVLRILAQNQPELAESAARQLADGTANEVASRAKIIPHQTFEAMRKVTMIAGTHQFIRNKPQQAIALGGLAVDFLATTISYDQTVFRAHSKLSN